MAKSLRSRPMTLYGSRRDSEVVPSSPARIPASLDDERPSSSSSAIPASASSFDQMSARRGSKVRGSRRPSYFPKASEVGQNVKKRLSMRYAQPTTIGPGGYSASPTDLVPSLPSLPAQFSSGVDPTDPQMPIIGDGFADEDAFVLQDGGGEFYEQGAPGGAQTNAGLESYSTDPAVNIEMLSQEKFDPQEYLRTNLSHHSANSMHSIQDTLLQAKSAANADLQRQVFKNYSEFITISKEIATLENDMLELKELLVEWKSLPQALEIDEGSSSLSDPLRSRARGNRNSMIDLQAIYRAQITSLWEGIEGSQKFLPYVPGRHLIYEGSSFTELNAATYRVKQSVALYLLDDVILIAVRRKRQMSAKVRLVAERCFNLAEIVVVDLRDGGDLSNAIKIKRGKESLVYRSERAEEKKALLGAFRRVAEELASKRRKENVKEAQERKRMSTLLGTPSSPTSSAMATANATFANMNLNEGGEDSVFATAAATAATEKKDPGRWIGDMMDQIAVHVAVREWGEAVELVEKGKALLSTYSPADPIYALLAPALRTHTNKLISSLCYNLSLPTLKKTQVVVLVSYLLTMGQGERAREIFLQARTEMLRKRSRMIKFEGDTTLYVSELALVYFTLVKNTSEWYVSAFKDQRMASGFVRWAAEQVTAFADIFRRQVYGVSNVSDPSENTADSEAKDSVTMSDAQVVREAIAITKSSAAQLKDVGLNFDYLLDELLQPEHAGNSALPEETAPSSAAANTGGSTTTTAAAPQKLSSGGGITFSSPFSSPRGKAVPLPFSSPRGKTIPLSSLSVVTPSAQELRRASVFENAMRARAKG